jgi:hypothetical protein
MDYGANERREVVKAAKGRGEGREARREGKGGGKEKRRDGVEGIVR